MPEAAPDEAAPEPVDELTMAAEPKLLVVVVVVVPITSAVAATSGAPVGATAGAIVPTGIGVTVATVLVPLEEAAFEAGFGAAATAGAAVALVADENVCALGVAALDEADPPEPELPLETLEVEVEVEPSAPAAATDAAAAFAELPLPVLPPARVSLIVMVRAGPLAGVSYVAVKSPPLAKTVPLRVRELMGVGAAFPML